MPTCPKCGSTRQFTFRGSSLWMIDADENSIACVETPKLNDESPTHCLGCHHTAPGGIFTGSVSHRFGVIIRQPMFTPYVLEFHSELLKQTQVHYHCEEFEIHVATGRTLYSHLDTGRIDSAITPGRTHLLFRLSGALTFWGVKVVDLGLEEKAVRDMASCGRLLAGFIRQKEPDAVLVAPESLAEGGQSWQRFESIEIDSQLTCLAREFDFYVSQDKDYRNNVRKYQGGGSLCAGTFEEMLRQNGLWKNLSPRVEKFIRGQLLHIHPWGDYTFDNGPDLGPTKKVSLIELAAKLCETLEQQHIN